jgi:hypothetical protein
VENKVARASACGFLGPSIQNKPKNPQAEQAAEKVVYFVIPSEARNLYWI